MDFSTPIITKTAEETKSLGRSLAHSLITQHQVICLYGELGSGKTTFIQGFAAGLGISERLLSPTFVVIKSYSVTATRMFHHLDLYRVSDTDNTQTEWIKELLSESGSIVAIEWPERIKSILPNKRTDIYFSVVSEGHSITITNI